MSDDDQATQGGDDTDDQDATGGGDAGNDADDQGADGSDGQDGDDGDMPLGPAGQKALEAEKAKRKREAQRRRQLEAELAELKGKSGDETEQARREAEQAALAKANARILRAEVKAAAAGKLADPKDALKLLDIDQFEVGEDGEVDTDEISSAIDDLIKSKPYLAAAQSTKRFQGGGDGGTRGRAASIDQQIATAEQKGDWNAARQLKLQKQYGGTKQ